MQEGVRWSVLQCLLETGEYLAYLLASSSIPLPLPPFLYDDVILYNGGRISCELSETACLLNSMYSAYIAIEV